jgi:hypothetical protein
MHEISNGKKHTDKLKDTWMEKVKVLSGKYFDKWSCKHFWKLQYADTI